MSFVLEYVSPQEIHKKFDLILEGLKAVKDHSGDTWRVEDVYMALKQNNSTLHIAYLNDDYAGFLILTPSQAYDGPVLHIWATYSKARDFCVFTAGMEHIRQFAKNLNANRITFYSPRKGWERHGAKLGFKPCTTKYAMEV